MSPNKPDRLGYATESTDREMDLRSRDRAILARLCRVFGYGVLPLGLLIAVSLLSSVAAAPRLVIAVLVIAVAPSVVLLVCASRIRAGGTVSVFVAMAVGILGVLFAAFMLLGGVLAAWQTGSAVTEFATLAIIGLLLAIGFGRMVVCSNRVIAIRGRDGADASAIIGVGERLAASNLSRGARRSCVLGGMPMALLHVGFLAAAGWAYVLSTTPVPVPPPPPAESVDPLLAAPFDGDVYNFKDGLPLAQRRMIADLAQAQLALTPEGVRSLDLGLKEFGGLLMRDAPQPLTPEYLRATLRFRKDERLPDYSYITNGRRSVNIRMYGDGSVGTAYMEPGLSTPRRRPPGDAEQLVRDAASGELHLTTGQARTLYPLAMEWSGGYEQMRLTIIRQGPDGTIEVKAKGQNPRETWITASGEQVRQDPVERSRHEEEMRAQLRLVRLLNLKPMLPGGVALISAAGLLNALLLIGAGWVQRVRRPSAALQILLSVVTVVAWLVLLRTAYPLQEAHWIIRRALVHPFWVITGLTALATIILAGVWIPLAVLRRGSTQLHSSTC